MVFIKKISKIALIVMKLSNMRQFFVVFAIEISQKAVRKGPVQRLQHRTNPEGASGSDLKGQEVHKPIHFFSERQTIKLK